MENTQGTVAESGASHSRSCYQPEPEKAGVKAGERDRRQGCPSGLCRRSIVTASCLLAGREQMSSTLCPSVFSSPATMSQSIKANWKPSGQLPGPRMRWRRGRVYLNGQMESRHHSSSRLYYSSALYRVKLFMHVSFLPHYEFLQCKFYIFLSH